MKITHEERIAKTEKFMREHSKLLIEIVLKAVSHSISKKDYMSMMTAMWESCPFIEEEENENN